MGTVSTQRQSNEDYVVKRVRSATSKKDKGWNWRYTLMLVGWFLMLFGFALFTANVGLSVLRIAGVFLACSAIPMVIPFGGVRRKWDMHFSEWVGFSLIGIGPYLAILFFLLNYIPVDRPDSNLVKVANIIRVDDGVIYELEDDYLEPCERFRTFKFRDHGFALQKVEELAINRYTGLFGIEVIRSVSPQPESAVYFQGIKIPIQ